MAKSLHTTFASREQWGRLRPLGFVRNDYTSGGQVRPVWRFRCECGQETEARAYNVTSGGTISCGCAVRDARQASARHGHASNSALSPTYRSWRNMLTRGRNPNINNADRYVLRGITVAAEWLPGGDGEGFARFLAHVGERPSNVHSIERINNDRSYEPGNVRWALQVDQANNTSSNVLIEYEGAQMTVAQVARAAGLKAQTIRDRIRLGWPADKLTAPRARAPFGLGKRSRPGVLPRPVTTPSPQG